VEKELGMAQKIQVLLTCDLDEDDIEAVGTVTFGYEGTTYAFELCQEHLDEFNETIQPYVAAARRADAPRRGRRSSAGGDGGSGRRGAARGDRGELATIREWARSNGFKVSDRGRISTEVREAYEAASA
jgi:hypothetical protein